MDQEEKVYIFFQAKEILTYLTSIEEIQQEVDEQLLKNDQDLCLLQVKLQLEYKYNNQLLNALAIGKKILQINPSNIDARLDIIHILQMMNCKNKQECFKQLISECKQLDPSYWRTYYVQLLFEQNKSNKADIINQLKHMTQKYPENPYFSTYLAQYYAQSSDTIPNSIQIVNEVIKNFKLDYEIIIRLAFIKLQLAQKEECKVHLKRAKYLNPKSPRVYNYLSYYYLITEKNYQKSIKYAKKVLELDPNSDYAYYHLAQSYFHSKENELSLQYHKKNYSLKNNQLSLISLIEIIVLSNKTNSKEMRDFYIKEYIKKRPNNSYGYICYLYEVSRIYYNQQQRDLEREEIYHHKLLAIFLNEFSYNQYKSNQAKVNQIYQ